MNFKTTILLIVALAIVGAAVFFARDRAPEPADRTTAIGTTDEQPLFDNLRAADVRRIRIERADARPVVAEKTDGTWRLIEPTPAAADQGLVESLSDQIANLQSRGQVRLDEHTRRQLGLHQPRLRVELTTADGKTTRLDLGERSGTGDGVYARKADGDQAHLVPAAIVESLDRPASAFRSKALVDVRPAEVREIRVTRPDETLALRQENGTWQILEPQPMPADDREAQDLITAVTNARAVEFITDDSAQASPYQLDDPAATIVISSVPAAQPDAEPTITTIRLGRYDDVLRRNVYAMSGDTGPIVKVPARVLEQVQQPAIELRSKEVVSIAPETVQRIVISTESSSNAGQLVELARMAAAADDASPTDDAAEHEEPAAPQPPSWQIASDPPAAADDAKVNRLLNALNPLRAQQFVASPPTPAIPTRHRLAMVAEIDGQQTEHVVQIEEPEDDAEPPVARYNGLVFEVSRSLLDHVRADFRASAEPAETEPPGSVPVEAAPHVSDGFTPQTAPEPAEFTPMPETP